MKNPIDQFVESARKVRLSDEVSARIRERLIAHMRAHPIAVRGVPSPYQRFFGILSPFTSSLRTPAVTLALILLATLGSTTAFAAARALPGDPLYPLKVNVIEPAQGLLAVSPEAKVEWQVSLTETRVNEVEQLAAKEKLTPEERIKSQESFDRSLRAAQATIQKLSRKNPETAEKIETSLTVSLNKHEDNLHQFGVAASSTNAAEAHAFADHIRTQTTVSTTTIDISPKEPKHNDKREQDRSSGKNQRLNTEDGLKERTENR